MQYILNYVVTSLVFAILIKKEIAMTDQSFNFPVGQFGYIPGAVPAKMVYAPAQPSQPVEGLWWVQTSELGAVENIYFYTGTEWLFFGLASGSVISETAPSNPRAGMRWFNPSVPVMYIYYVDGDSGQWVEEASQSTDGALRDDLGAVDSTVPIAGVPAGELAKNFDSYVNAANYLYGAVSDSAAVAAAIPAAGTKAVLIPDIGRRWNLVNIQLNDDQTVFGYGTEIELTTNAGALFHGKRSVIHGFNFYGSGKASGSTSQNAVSILSSLSVGSEKTRTKTYDCNFYDLGGSAWIVRNTVNNHEGNILSNYHIKDCNIGVNLDVRGEYASWGNGNISLCNVGVRVQGGNSIATGSVISDCAVAVDLVNGSNDSHGAIVGALINHNTVTIRAGILQSKAFLFQGCMLYYGKIELTGTEGLNVENCEIFSMPIYEDGAVNCTFRNNKWKDDPVNYPNYNGNASEVFYIDNLFPSTTSNLQQWGIDGGYLRARRTSSITNIVAGTDRDVVFNNRESNAITGNLSYTKQLFLDTATGYLNTNTKFIKRQFNNNVTSIINIGIADTLSLPAKADVDVVLYDTNEGLIKGVFVAGPEYAITGYKLRNYYFNGVIPKGIYVVRILNRSSVTLTSFSDQPATPNIRSYITADM